MFPISVHDQLPQDKLSGLLVAFAQGIWGQLEDGSEGFTFPDEAHAFTWSHDQNYLEQEHGVTEEALMDCVEQFEEQLGSPDEVRRQFGLMKGAGQAYIGLTVTSRLDPRIVCSYTPTSHNGPTVEGYFEWYVKDQTNSTIGTDDTFLSNFEVLGGVPAEQELVLPPTLPSYEEACLRLAAMSHVTESAKHRFLQRLWDLRKTIAAGYQNEVRRDLLGQWTGMLECRE